MRINETAPTSAPNTKTMVARLPLVPDDDDDDDDDTDDANTGGGNMTVGGKLTRSQCRPVNSGGHWHNKVESVKDSAAVPR